MKRLFRKLFGYKNKISVSTCECGEHEECVRNIYSSTRGNLYIKNKEHFSCGEVQKQIKNIKAQSNLYKNGEI